ncbi:hypothetical protein BU17DRAFT_67457 [Hysterangium stoloniferum]|nr:hypothetical protein BU17DRAFT_67457 [Hysterangium stoloniferum]
MGIAKATILGEILKETRLEATNSGPLSARIQAVMKVGSFLNHNITVNLHPPQGHQDWVQTQALLECHPLNLSTITHSTKPSDDNGSQSSDSSDKIIFHYEEESVLNWRMLFNTLPNNSFPVSKATNTLQDFESYLYDQAHKYL